MPLLLVSTRRNVSFQAIGSLAAVSSHWGSNLLLRSMAQRCQSSDWNENFSLYLVERNKQFAAALSNLYYNDHVCIKFRWNLLCSYAPLPVLLLVLSLLALSALVQHYHKPCESRSAGVSHHSLGGGGVCLSHLSRNANEFGHSTTVARCHSRADSASQQCPPFSITILIVSGSSGNTIRSQSIGFTEKERRVATGRMITIRK